MTETELRTAELNRKIEVLNTALIGLQSLVDYCLEAKVNTKILAAKIKAYIQQTNQKLSKEYQIKLNNKIAELPLCGKLFDVYNRQTGTKVGFAPCQRYARHEGSCGPKSHKPETGLGAV
jgi:hypothetical protein